MGYINQFFFKRNEGISVSMFSGKPNGVFGIYPEMAMGIKQRWEFPGIIKTFWFYDG